MLFIPRLTDVGLTDNAYYNEKNYWTSSDFQYSKLSASDWATTYHAMARSCEIAHRPIDRRWNADNPIFANRDGWNSAKEWANETTWETGTTPRLGAIVVWTGTKGHLGVVEEIFDNGNISISQSEITVSGSVRKFYLDKNTSPNSSLYTNLGYTFVSYIYNPYVENKSVLVDRDTNYNQISTDNSSIRIREGHGTSSNTLGLVSPTGYYNVIDTYQGSDYLWYKIDQYGWVANVPEIVYHPMEITYKRYSLSLYDNGQEVGAAFGKKATKGNVVEFDRNIEVMATQKNNLLNTVSVDAYDLVMAGNRETWTFTLEDGSTINKEISAWTLDQ